MIFGEKDQWKVFNSFHDFPFGSKYLRINMKRKPGFAFFVVLFLMLQAINVLAGYPQRIISLAPSLTKTIYLLHAENQMVGCTSFCILKHPDDAQVVATAVQVNIEKAVLLKPDLVLTSSLTNPETIRTFQKLGIKTLNFPYPQSFDDICHYVQILGEKLGKSELADSIVADARKKLAIVRAKVPTVRNKPSVFLQIGANPLFTVVPNTFMQDFIDFSGCRNIAGDLTLGSVTRESVLVRNPDVIIIAMMGSVSEEEKSKWETYKNLNAVKNHKVFLIDQERTCSPTPELFVEALDDIISYVYH